MKRAPVFLSLALLLAFVLVSDVCAQEQEGWDVYRKARPKGIAKLSVQSPALGKILAPLGIPEGPPIEYDRTVTMDSVTIVIGPSEPDQFYGFPKSKPKFKKDDVVLLKANPPNGWTGYNLFVLEHGAKIEPGAVFVYDVEYPVMLQIYTSNDYTGQDTSAIIGAPDGEIVNFIGSGRTEKLFPEQVGSFGLTGAGNIIMHNVVIHNHQYGLSMNLTNFRNSKIEGSNVYVFNNTIGFVPPGDPENKMRKNLGLNGYKEFDAQLNLTDSWFSGNWYADIGPIMKYSRFGGTVTSSALISPRPVWVEDIGQQWIDRKLELRDCGFKADVMPYLDERISFAKNMVKLTETINGSVSQYWPIQAPNIAFDINRNGVLDINDLKYLADRFSQPINGANVPWYLDYNNNGVVDLEDLLAAGFQYTNTTSINELANSAKAESLATVLVRYQLIVDAIKADTKLWNVFGPLLTPTAVEDEQAAIPSKFALNQNYPNPFNSQTIIRFTIEKDGEVRLVIRNLLGRVVRTLVQEHKESGWHTQKWDGRNEMGVPLASGVYLYELRSGSEYLVRKLMILR